jgi:hypothetical protein
MKDLWGWELPEDRLKRYGRTSPRRKLEALEEMRRFILKYGIKKRRAALRSAPMR